MNRPRTLWRIVVLTVVGIVFWMVVRAVAGVSEPWDARTYWSIAYPLSLIMSGVAGAWMGRRGWMAGVVLTLSQFPVMLVPVGPDQMVVLALILLCALAIPAAVLSAITGLLAHRWRVRSA